MISEEKVKSGEESRFCVLVNSSDRARDIFEIVFGKAETMWRDCNWPRFVGFTSALPDIYGFKSVAAPGSSDWRSEFAGQLDSLPSEIAYVLRLEEDALSLAPVNGKKLQEIGDIMLRDDLSYVSLVPVSRSIVCRGVDFFRKKLSKRPLRPVSFSEPYYSSLVPAIWKRSYLRELLRQPGSIWEFEFTVTGERHYAVWDSVLELEHLVSKGKWSWRAPRQLARQGLSLANSKRGFQTVRSRLRSMREKLSFQLFGYLSLRIRRRLNLLPAMPKDLTGSQLGLISGTDKTSG